MESYIYSALSSVISNSECIKNEDYAKGLITKLSTSLHSYKCNDSNICPVMECLAVSIEKFGTLAAPYVH